MKPEMGESRPLHRIAVTVPIGPDEDRVDRFCNSGRDGLFGDGIVHAALRMRVQDGDEVVWRVEWVVEGAMDIGGLGLGLNLLATVAGVNLRGGVAVTPIDPDTNWLEESYRQFPAFTLGRFFVRGSHCDDPVPPGQIPLTIDAATAFGSGTHGTTAGCLMLMQGLVAQGFRPRAVLDMGCGSGILAVAACKLWESPDIPVEAVDIDPEAAIVTDRHSAMNGTTDRLSPAVAGDGFAVVAGRRYDLILANILPRPLIDMADSLAAALHPGGYAILSGMLHEHVDGVVAAYAPLGLRPVAREDLGEWAALLLQRL